MKTAEYKKGVLEIISRAREINPQIGKYIDHKPAGPDHFQIKLSNGSLTLPRLVARSQQELPSNVSREWVVEISNTFEASAVEARKHTGTFITRFLNWFAAK